MSTQKLLNTFEDIKTFMDSLVAGNYLLKAETNYHAGQGRNKLLTAAELSKLVALPVITQAQVDNFTAAYDRGDWNAAIVTDLETDDPLKIASASTVFDLKQILDGINAELASNVAKKDEDNNFSTGQTIQGDLDASGIITAGDNFGFSLGGGTLTSKRVVHRNGVNEYVFYGADSVLSGLRAGQVITEGTITSEDSHGFTIGGIALSTSRVWYGSNHNEFVFMGNDNILAALLAHKLSLFPVTSSALEPTLAFGDSDTGFYESADDVLNVSTAGVSRLSVSTTDIISDLPLTVNGTIINNSAYGVSLGSVPGKASIGHAGGRFIFFKEDGSSATINVSGLHLSESPGTPENPSLSFGNDGTGFYESTDNVLNIATDTVSRLSVSTTDIISDLPLTVNGTIINNSAYGVSLGNVPGKASIGHAGGRFIFFKEDGSSATINVSGLHLSESPGTPANPSLGFGNGGTGLYESADDVLNISTGTVSRLSISTTDIIADLPVTAPSFVRTGGTSSQFLKADGSVDENVYALDAEFSDYAKLDGSNMPFTGDIAVDGRINMAQGSGITGDARGMVLHSTIPQETRLWLRTSNGSGDAAVSVYQGHKISFIFNNYETGISAIKDGAASLYYNNSIKLSTNASGAEIIGDGHYLVSKNDSDNVVSQLGADGSGDGYFLLRDFAGNNKVLITGDASVNYINAGNLGIGTNAPQTKLHVQGAGVSEDDLSYQTLMFDTSTQAEGTGGGIAFGGYYTDTNTPASVLAGIKAYKENGTSGSSDSALSFFTRQSGVSPSISEKMRISSEGNVSVNSGSLTISNTFDARLFLKDGNGSNFELASGHIGNGIFSLREVDSGETMFTVDGDGQLILPKSGTAAKPTLSLGANNSGLYLGSQGELGIAIGGAAVFHIDGDGFTSEAGPAGAFISKLEASTVHPVFSFAEDQDTGIGRLGSDRLSLIAGGSEVARLTGTNPTDKIMQVYGSLRVGLSNNTSITDNGSNVFWDGNIGTTYIRNNSDGAGIRLQNQEGASKVTRLETITGGGKLHGDWDVSGKMELDGQATFNTQLNFHDSGSTSKMMLYWDNGSDQLRLYGKSDAATLADGNIHIYDAGVGSYSRTYINAQEGKINNELIITTGNLGTYTSAEADTLDSVTGRGNTTTNTIVTGGGTFNGEVTVNAGSSNQLVIKDTSAGTAANPAIAFKDSADLRLGEIGYLSSGDNKFTIANPSNMVQVLGSAFEFNGNEVYHAGNLPAYVPASGGTFSSGIVVQGVFQVDHSIMSVGADGLGSSIIRFFDDSADTYRGLRWDDASSEFKVEDSSGQLNTLIHAGNIGNFTTTEVDTLQSVTQRGATTTNTITAPQFEATNHSTTTNDSIAFKFSEGRGWGYNAGDNAVFYNASGGVTPMVMSDLETNFQVPVTIEGRTEVHGRLKVHSSGNQVLAADFTPLDTRTGIQPVFLYRNSNQGTANYMLVNGSNTYFGVYAGGVPTDASNMVAIQPSNSGSPELRVGDAGSAAAKLYINGDLAATQNWVNAQNFSANTGTVTQVNAGAGLSVSNATTTPTISLDFDQLGQAGTLQATDDFVVMDGSAAKVKQASAIGLSIFNNDAGFTTLASVTKAYIDGLNIDADTLDTLTSADFIRSNQNTNVTGHTQWQDGYDVRLGTGADLRLLHESGTSYIRNNTGDLYLRNYSASGDIKLQVANASGDNRSGLSVIGDVNTSVRLFYNGSARLNTTDTGISVSGIVSANGGNSNNWNTAYGWGDHAGLYAAASHNHNGVYEPVFTKNSAFNKNFGTGSGTVAEGNDSRILHGETAYGWGNHASAGYLTSYTETDTLASVTARGSSTTSNVIFGGTEGAEIKRGIHGAYISGEGSNWGANIWAIGAGNNSSGHGTSYTTGNHYGLAWIRGSHADATSSAGEGLYIYHAGVLQVGLGSAGIYTDSHGTSSQWNTAYGWGNHASAGYLTGESDTLQSVTDRGATTTNRIIVGSTATNETLRVTSNNPYVSFYTNGSVRQGYLQKNHDSDFAMVAEVGDLSLVSSSGNIKLTAANVTIGGNDVATEAWVNAQQFGDITGVTAGTNLNGGGASGDVTLNLNSALTGISSIALDGILIDESDDRSGLLEIHRDGSHAWTGYAIDFDGQHWALMGNASNVGLYDDSAGDWFLYCASGGGVDLRYGGVSKLATTSAGGTLTGTWNVNGALTVAGNTVATQDWVNAQNFGGITQVSVGTGLDVSNATTTPNITLDFSEISQAGTLQGTDDFVVLDGSSTRIKQASAIGLSIFNNDTNYIGSQSSIASSALDSTTGYGIRQVTYSGYSKHLLSWNAGGSTGSVQQEFDYNTPVRGWRIRNKTDNNTWSAWGYVAMTTANQGHITGSLLHSNNLTTYITASYINGLGVNATTLDGLDLHTGRNNEANKVVRTDANGYIQAGWINTTSGDNGTINIDRVYASNDGYLRYYSLNNFRQQLLENNEWLYSKEGKDRIYFATDSHTYLKTHNNFYLRNASNVDILTITGAGHTTVNGYIRSTYNDTYSPRYDTAFYVLQSKHWYSHSSSDLMFLGESGNTIHVRGLLSVARSDQQTVFQSVNTSPVPDLTQFIIRHDFADTVVESVRGNLFLGASVGVHLRYAGSTRLVTTTSGVTVTGTVTASNFVDISDSRLKEELSLPLPGLSLINKLEPKLYLKNDIVESGFYADQLPEEAGYMRHKIDGDYWGMDYKNLHAVQVNAIKELNQKVQSLEEEKCDLESRVIELEAKMEMLMQKLG